MRILFCLVLILVHSVAIARDGGWNPNTRNKRKKPNQSGYVGTANLQRGPQYSAADAPPSQSEIQNLIQASNPNSPNSIAAQGLGIQGGGDCSAQQAAKSQYNALLSQIKSLEATVRAESQAISGCGLLNTACQIAHANAATNAARQAGVLAVQAGALAGAMSQPCSGGGSTTQAQPPVVSLATVAKRFNVPMQGAPRGTGGSGNNLALQQAIDIDEDNGRTDFDGRGRAVAKSMNVYSQSARRAAVMGGRVQAGRQFAGGKMPTFDNPANLAQAEYLKINYSELGPKYDALVQERARAADKVAVDVLQASAPPAPLPDSGYPPLLPIDGSGAQSIGGAGVSSSMKDLIQTNLAGSSGMLGNRLSNFIGVLNIQAAVGRMTELQPALYEAIAQLGSSSMSSSAIDKFQQQWGAYANNVNNVNAETFENTIGGRLEDVLTRVD